MQECSFFDKIVSLTDFVIYNTNFIFIFELYITNFLVNYLLSFEMLRLFLALFYDLRKFSKFFSSQKKFTKINYNHVEHSMLRFEFCSRVL